MPAIALYTFGLVAPTDCERREFVTAQATRIGSTPAGLVRWRQTTGLVGSADEVPVRPAEYAAAGVTDVILALPERVPTAAFFVVTGFAGRAVGAPPAAFGVRRDANLVDMLVGRHRAGGRGGLPAGIDPDGTSSFDELWSAALSAAAGLGGAGVRRGDRAAIALRDGRPWVAALLGAAWCGAVAIPVDPLSPLRASR